MDAGWTAADRLLLTQHGHTTPHHTATHHTTQRTAQRSLTQPASQQLRFVTDRPVAAARVSAVLTVCEDPSRRAVVLRLAVRSVRRLGG